MNIKVKKIILYIILFAIFITTASYTYYLNMNKDIPEKDAGEYLLMAYNLQKYGTLSLETKDIENPEPTAFREPVLPAYTALCIFINPATRNMDREEIFTKGTRYLKIMQIPLLLILSILSFYIVYLLTKNSAAGFFALFLVGSSITAEDTINRLLSENISALLILINAILIYKLMTQRKIVFFILLGIFSGILVLDKAVFLYFLFLLPLFLIIYYLKTRFIAKKIFITGLVLMILLSSIVPCAWMSRNYYHFKHFALTGRGGIVLLIRAEKDNMTLKEYVASFLYWTPSEKIRTQLLPKMFPYSDYERLDRTNKNSFYYKVTRVDLGAKNDPETNTILPEYTSFEKDAELRSKAIGIILKHPFRHILAVPQFVWRGIFTETGFLFDLPGSTKIELINNNILNIFMFFSLFYMFIYSIRKKLWQIFAFLLSGIYLFLINSFFTHNIPRYSAPIIPVLIISTVIFVYFRLYPGKIRVKEVTVNN